jgi:hypothetical protein
MHHSSNLPPDDRFTPRALLRRQFITVDLTPSELHRLVRALEAEATAATADGRDDFADFLLRRVAELREASR